MPAEQPAESGTGLQLRIDLSRQRLRLLQADALLAEYPVSTARYGIGEIVGSGMTPRGLHRVRAKIGAGAPIDSVFRGRRATGEIWSPTLHAQFPRRDWILSRILWLSGLERGRNRLGCVDTFRRYIYLHGTPASEPLGVPGSHGCIRMASADIIDLYERVPVGTHVLLHE